MGLVDPARAHVLYTITQGGRQIGQVLVAGTANGDYDAKTEYWYMTANVSSTSDLTFTSGSSESWSNPPSETNEGTYGSDEPTGWYCYTADPL